MPVVKLGTKVFCVHGCNPLEVAQPLRVGVTGHEKEKLIPLLCEYAYWGQECESRDMYEDWHSPREHLVQKERALNSKFKKH